VSNWKRFLVSIRQQSGNQNAAKMSLTTEEKLSRVILGAMDAREKKGENLRQVLPFAG
jgi:hypothetical protein